MRQILVTLLIIFMTGNSPIEAGIKRASPKSSLNAVTYDFSGGRFGDNLVSYLHGKWVAHVLQIPFLYRPFEFSDQLVMDREESCMSDFQFKVKLRYRKGMDLISLKRSGVLAIIPFFPEFEWEIKNLDYGYPHMKVNWDDVEFQKKYKPMVRPLRPIEYIDVPSGRISVAIHFRSAMGLSSDQDFVNLTQRFLPLDYYITQWKKLLEVLQDRPIYVHLFTDDPNPEAVLENFRSTSPDADVIYGCRFPEEKPTDNVLDDFFRLSRFDCIIRSDSNFSLCAALVGDVAVEMFPVDSIIENNVRKVTEFGIKINSHLLEMPR